VGSTLPHIWDVAGAGLTLDGTGQALTISGGGLVRVLWSVTSLTLDRLTIADGKAPDVGGGGGVFHTGALNIANSVFSNNSTSSNYNGGGISGSGGTLTVTDSTFSGNSAPGLGSAGAIDDFYGTTTITNSTFSGNSAGQWGGGIASGSGTLAITNSTFSGNSAGLAGAAVSNLGSTVTLRNTIAANSTTGGNCDGTITNDGNNIDDGTTCGWGSASGSKSSTDPLLGALADNGGPTRTFALLAGSPAIDAGDDATCANAPVNGLDQRGIARPQGAHCDIGSFESVLLAISGNAGIGGATLNFTGGSTAADGSGNYSFTVSSSWNGTVTPAKTGYTFLPNSKAYSNVVSDQPNQNYTAMTGGAPTVLQTYPADGGEACLRPQIGVGSILTDLVRTGGSFNPAAILLELDGLDVTGAATFAQTETYPASLAVLLYTPPGDLALGAHEAVLSYPSPGGTLFRHWNFTVIGTSCSTSGSHSPASGSAPDPGSANTPQSDFSGINSP
jgi:hypothetical protein